jgi:hypothetical protein
LAAGHRYNAACAAALAAAGGGTDAGKLDGEERARLRGQALTWLRADLSAWGRVAQKSAEAHPQVRRTLTHWRQDADLVGVRGKDALAKLPAAERAAWQKLWAEVDDLLRRAGPAG